MTTLIPRKAAKPARFVASLAERLLTPHGIDRYLELVDPMLVRKEVRGEVVRVRHQTPDTVTLTLGTNQAWQGFQAGQYVRVSVDIDGVRRTRCYSPANSQSDTDGTLELTVKVDPNGLVSRYLHEHAHVGMVLGISKPDGEFLLPEIRPRDILLISGGSGITPVLSMLRTLSHEGYSGRVVFLHYANTADDVLYRDELSSIAEEAHSVRIAYGYTHPDSDAPTRRPEPKGAGKAPTRRPEPQGAGEAPTRRPEPQGAGGADLNGFFTTEHLDQAAPWWRDAETYLCGPPGLMDSVQKAYEAAGLSEHLHTEVFTPPEIEIDTANANGQVRFSHSGREIANSGKPLLEQAEAAGLRPEHGCRMGICFSCTKVKTTGCVRNALTGDLSTDPDEEIQMCISVPVGDVDINC